MLERISVKTKKMATQRSGIKIMAKLMAGFIKNCKIILLMLIYEIMLSSNVFRGLAKLRARRKGYQTTLPKANKVGGRLGRSRVDCFFKR